MRARTIGCAVLLLALSACTGSDGSSRTSGPASPTASPTSSPTAPAASGASSAGVPAGLASFYAQRVHWTACGTLQCGTVQVPLDYAAPGGARITVHLDRSPATATRIGTLFVNPGGPGVAGLGLTAAVASAAPRSITAAYDIVGFDPRGVGTSDPLHCFGTAALDRYLATDVTPDTAAAARRLPAQMAAQGRACARNSGALASHVTTVETARDLDVMRAAVGADHLDYLGYSYGTLLGATYAALFPKLVGRLVLDGPDDPDESPDQRALAEAKGFQTALDSWAANCVAKSCVLGSNDADVEGAVTTLLHRADRSPVRTSTASRPLTEALAYLGVINQLYSVDQWPRLTSSIEAALHGNGTALLAAVDAVYGRGRSGYTLNTAQALNAIDCLDDRVSGHSTTVPSAAFRAASPVLGAEVYGSEVLRGCAAWPLRPSVTAPDYRAPGAAPILVLGTTRDPATPYSGAVAFARMLSSGVLLTRDGDGHTAFLVGNACIDTAVAAYLVHGSVPAAGTRC